MGTLTRAAEPGCIPAPSLKDSVSGPTPREQPRGRIVKLEKLAAVSEIVSSFAIVATLAYLDIRTREMF